MVSSWEVVMRYVFLFSGGGLDGNALHHDDEETPNWNTEGKKAFDDTDGGTVGRQFEVINPDTPPDGQGTVWKFRCHLYEVTQRDVSKTKKILIHCKHVRGIE